MSCLLSLPSGASTSAPCSPLEQEPTITNATIQLGHNLGLKVVAEGVEDQQTFNTLLSMGCDLQQGFFISKPISAESITTWQFQE